MDSFCRAVLLCASFFFPLHAKMEDHFKKAEGKTDIHKMPNIDFIYMINLDQRPEKFKKCTDQLHPYGIFPYRFSAVNGWHLTLEAINEVGLQFQPGMQGGFWGTSYLPGCDLEPYHEIIQNYGQTYFCHCTARGTIGIALSHLSVLQDAWDSGYETIWVMEDDIEVIQNPNTISKLIRMLDKKVGKKGWDVLFTDKDIRNANGEYIPSFGMAKRPNFNPQSTKQYYACQQIDSTFILKGSRFGAHSMILRRSGIEKILHFIKNHKIFLPYDMDFYLPEGIRMYSLVQDVVSNQTKAISDNGAPNYLH
jgi:GR25 family glycosyltransferase involved in LPS biosynthesis